MKKTLIIILIGINVSFLSTLADQCPYVHQFPSTHIPPAGWTMYIPPVFPGKNYHFANATHSFNGTFYKYHVLCTYECSKDTPCSPFTLLSNASYQSPSTNTAPWNVYPNLMNTFVCSPKDHDPVECLFD